MKTSSRLWSVFISFISLGLLIVALSGCGNAAAPSTAGDNQNEDSNNLESQEESVQQEDTNISEPSSDQDATEQENTEQEETVQEEATIIHIQSSPDSIYQVQNSVNKEEEVLIGEDAEVIDITEENYHDYFEVEEKFITHYNVFDEPDIYYYVASAVLKKEFAPRYPVCNVSVEYEYNAYQDLSYLINNGGDLEVTKYLSKSDGVKSVVGDFIPSFEKNQPPYHMIIFSVAFDPQKEVIPNMADSYVLKRVKGTLALFPEAEEQVESALDVTGHEVICVAAANVRIGPDQSTRRVGVMQEGDVFQTSAAVYGPYDQIWYRITLENGVIGYVRGDLVELQ